MTKRYMGNDVYHIYLDSGKVLEVTTEELAEICDDAPQLKDAREEIDALKADIKEELDILSEALGNIESLIEEKGD